MVSGRIADLGVPIHQGAKPRGEHQHEWGTEVVCPNLPSSYTEGPLLYFCIPNLAWKYDYILPNWKYAEKKTRRNISLKMSLTHHKITAVHSLSTCHPYISLQTILSVQAEIIASHISTKHEANNKNSKTFPQNVCKDLSGSRVDVHSSSRWFTLHLTFCNLNRYKINYY